MSWFPVLHGAEKEPNTDCDGESVAYVLGDTVSQESGINRAYHYDWLKRIIAHCKPEEIKKSYFSKMKKPLPENLLRVFNAEELNKYTQMTIKDVLDQLNDPKQTPHGDLGGALGELKHDMLSSFPLTPNQKSLFLQGVKKVLGRNKSFFNEVNKQCSPKDMRLELPPTIDQKDSPMCYAFSLSAELGRKVLTQEEARRDPISATAIFFAYQYQALREGGSFANKYFSEGPNLSLGASYADALKASAKVGLCRNSQVSNDFRKFTSAPSTPNDYKKIFPLLSLEEISRAITSNKWETINKLIHAACPNPIPVGSLKIIPNQASSRKDPINYLLELQSRLKNDIVGAGHDGAWGHAVDIVGQRINGHGMCEFIVRNTFGKDCGVKTLGTSNYLTQHCDGMGNSIVPATLLVEKIDEFHTLGHLDQVAPVSIARPANLAR